MSQQQPQRVETPKPVAARLVHMARSRQADPRAVWGIPWFLDCLNEQTGGIHPEEYTVLMARPGVGKTVFAGQQTLFGGRWLQSEEGAERFPDHVIRGVLCEMSKDQFMLRLACYLSGVPMRTVRQGQMTSEQVAAYEGACADLSDLPVELFDGTTGVDETIAFIRGSGTVPGSSTRPTAWWFVDYLGIHPAPPGLELRAKVTYLSAQFRELCRRTAPGLVLAQMNRDCEKRADKRPQMSDLRESGDVEQDAWNILGLYGEDIYVYQPPDLALDPRLREIIVLKQRQGMGNVPATLSVVWNPAKGEYRDARSLLEEDGL